MAVVLSKAYLLDMNSCPRTEWRIHQDPWVFRRRFRKTCFAKIRLWFCSGRLICRECPLVDILAIMPARLAQVNSAYPGSPTHWTHTLIRTPAAHRSLTRPYHPLHLHTTQLPPSPLLCDSSRPWHQKP